jgi:hypothetical protein
MTAGTMKDGILSAMARAAKTPARMNCMSTTKTFFVL